MTLPDRHTNLAAAQGNGEWKGDRPAVWRMYFQKLAQQPSPGVFVDVGAGDGRFMSNTAYLERHHCWRGIAVEPTDNEYPKLEKNRPGATTVRVDTRLHFFAASLHQIAVHVFA